MSFNLIDAAKGLITNELVSKASSYLGESDSGVAKAFSGILPTVINGIASKASTTDGANAVSQMVQDQHNSGILGNLGSFFGGDSAGGSLLSKGSGLLGSIFGGKLDSITSLISNFSGLKSSSATTLLSMAAPAILGLIGKHSSGGASGLASLFSSQKDNISAAIPSGLNLSSVLGNAASTVTSTAKTAVTNTARVVDDTVDNASGGGMKILLPLLLLAAAALGAWYLFGKGCNKGTDATTTVDTTVKMTTGVDTVATTTIVMPTHESLKVKLVNGTEINAYKGGIESQLVDFLNNKSMAVDTVNGNWFDFDNLNFNLGKSTLTDSSRAQISNIVAILKAYPAAKFRVGGYTDASGNADANLKLSQARADAVKAAILASGAAATQLADAKGYGSQFAKIPATASEEARRSDRRTSVRVMSK